MKIQKVLSGRRITIPEQMAKKHGIKVGDIVIVQDSVRALEIFPVDIVPRNKDKKV